MKFTKKVFLSALVIVFATAGLFAQDEVSPEFKKRANHRLEKAAKKLNLSDEQKAAFAEIHKKYMEKAKVAKEETQSREVLADVMYENRKAKTAEIKDLLTPEQYAIFDKVDKDKKRRKGKRGHRAKKGKEAEQY